MERRARRAVARPQRRAGGSPSNHSSQYASSEASTTSWRRGSAAASSSHSSGAVAAVGLPGKFSHSSPRRSQSTRARSGSQPFFSWGENGWLPALEGVDWARVAILWLNYPNNPTGATAPLAFYEGGGRAGPPPRVRARVRRGVLGAVLRRRPEVRAAGLATGKMLLCSTHCRSDRRCPATAPGSSRATPRSSAALKKYRPNVGVAPPEFFQRAVIAAWNDEAHVDEVRERYRAKRDAMLPALEAMGPAQRRRRRHHVFLWLEGSRRARRGVGSRRA